MPIFTGMLGTINSQLGQIELAFVPPPPVSTVNSPPEIILGPPLRGSPWLQRLPIDPIAALANQAPIIVSYPVQEITSGPPIRGAPFIQRLPVEPTHNNQGVVPSPFVAVQEIHAGPPMRGVPFVQHLFVEMDGLGAGAPPPPPPPVHGDMTYAPELHAGPPLRGAPFLARLPIIPQGVGLPTPPPPPPPPPPPITINKPFIIRVKTADEQDNKRRLDRITQQLSSIFNSLIGQGVLVQTGPATWELVLGGINIISFNGRTGAVTLLAADVINALSPIPTNTFLGSPGFFRPIADGDLPNTGVVSGSYVNPTIVVDQHGRITSAINGTGVGGNWTSLPYAPGWSDFGSGFQVGQYQIDGTGRVWLRGLLTPPSLASQPVLIATLPVGFRPPATVLCEAFADDTKAVRIDVAPTGTISYTAGPTSASYLTITPISFSINT